MRYVLDPVVSRASDSTNYGNEANRPWSSTEAAAVTIVSVVFGGGEGLVENPPEVHIDRPFIFAIRDTQTGTLLFLGRVMNPTA